MAKKKKTLEELLEEALVSKEEQPYEVPENWLWIRLENLLSSEKNPIKRGPFGSSIKKAYFVPIGYKVYEQKNAIYNDFTLGDYYIDEDKFNELRGFEIKCGDFIVSCSGTIGKIAEVPNNIEKGIMNQALLKIRLNNKVVLNKYFYELFKSDMLLKNIKNKSRGTAIKNIASVKILKNAPFALPSIKEQQRIVNKIESIFSKIDKAKELVEEAREGFENRKAAILAKAFRGKLTKKWREENPHVESAEVLLEKIKDEREKSEGKKKKKAVNTETIEEPYELPEKWTWVTVKDISILVTKGASPKWQGINYIDDDSQVLFITSENVRDGYIDLSKEKYLEIEFNNKQSRSILENGDVLLNIVGASIGRAAIFQINKIANINQAVSIIRLVDKSINRYLNYYLNAPSAKKYYMQSKVDVARANLSLKNVSNIPLPLPSLEEQKEIVRILEKLLEEETKIDKLTQLEDQIELLKKSILAKAFRGELGTNDPTEESALELLKEVLKDWTVKS
ncbi:MAG: restriction endonuclease subunit S [Marinisporobacter sp.]|jgi:restriction endonuclease S subunit|nr:restriction endonuclease subunit S [Marinisporobacter sp.]